MATTITTAAGLQNMKLDLTEDYILGANIDCSSIGNFEPVGGWSGQAAFTGSFDGKGYSILNFVINRAADDYIGLFGETDGATIQNVVVEVTITGDDYVGGLVGYSASSVFSNCSTSGTITSGAFIGGLIGYSYQDTITNCNSSSTITSDGGHVGGLIGQSYDSDVTDSHATGGITSTYPFEIGGFIGELWYGDILRCHATGNVTAGDIAWWGASGVGGFVGYTDGALGTIDRCYSTGDVVALDGTTAACENGGFVGQLNDTVVTDCYATGAVTSNGSAAFAGTNDGAIDNCYGTGLVTGAACGGLVAPGGWNAATDSFWDTQTTGQATSDSGTGKTTIQMKDIETFSAAGWDISRIWGMSATCNNGYACLIDVNACCPTQQGPPADPTIAPKKVVLEAIRNLEIMNNARFYISKTGNAIWESRFHRG